MDFLQQAKDFLQLFFMGKSGTDTVIRQRIVLYPNICMERMREPACHLTHGLPVKAEFTRHPVHLIRSLIGIRTQIFPPGMINRPLPRRQTHLSLRSGNLNLSLHQESAHQRILRISLYLKVCTQHLYLHLYNGEQFENLKSQAGLSRNVPYRRETFREKHTLIQFDTQFNMVDGNFLNRRSDIKNMNEITHAIDSLTAYADSLGRSMHSDIMQSTYKAPILSKSDSVKIQEEKLSVINIDSVFNTLTSAEKLKTLSTCENRLSSLSSDWSMKSYLTKETDANIRGHRSDWHKKITLSLACIIFFFIGAPLGAIIRKGGLGMPVVLSVLIFILYYIIDSGATRVAKSGEMNIILGTWMSTLVLAPLGGFLTYKSNKDSVVFNIDVYIAFFRKLLGIRQSRHIFKKEVIIHTPDYADIVNRLEAISGQCQDYANKHKLLGPPNYFLIFTNNEHDDAIREISLQMENLIEELSNSKDNILLNMLNKYPYLSVKAHKSLFDNRWLNLIFGIIVPAGLLVWLNIWRYRVRLDKDLKVILKTNEELENHIRTNLL